MSDPLTPPFQTIGDRKINVAMKLGNRADLLQPAVGSVFTYSRISGWLRDAYIATATCRVFEQTQTTLQFSTAAGSDTYPVPADMRAKIALTGYDQYNTPIIMDEKNITYIRRYNSGQTGPGSAQNRPSLYCFFGSSIIFRPVPNGSFNMYLDYWQKPLIDSTLDDTELLLPDEWLEIIDYEAAVRGNAELLQEDKSRLIQELIYGFMDPTTQHYVPGLIERLQNREQAQSPYKDYGLQPPYSGGYTK